MSKPYEMTTWMKDPNLNKPVQSKEELIAEMTKAYVTYLEGSIQRNKEQLGLKDWAMDGSEYHRSLRQRLKDQIELAKQHIKILTQ